MLLGESVFSSMNPATAAMQAPMTTLPIEDSKFNLDVLNSEDADPLMGSTEATNSLLDINEDVFESVFASDAPLFSESVNEDELETFFNESPVSVKSEEIEEELLLLLNQETPMIESRSMSAPVGSLSLFDNSLLEAKNQESSKRSYSVMSGMDAINEEDVESFPKKANNGSRKDNLGCTPYTRKQRSAPLPPVVAKSGDVASIKRARNTEAARRSRARKMERMTQLETKCEDLIKENEELKMELKALKSLLGR
ncbi:amino acid starvation-responsive transcription factor [Martiniozyma asiatica (nom. inval.)]|nr:amino acid starvation-responsive transcription factor [Martiniozyma asiatica]